MNKYTESLLVGFGIALGLGLALFVLCLVVTLLASALGAWAIPAVVLLFVGCGMSWSYYDFTYNGNH